LAEATAKIRDPMKILIGLLMGMLRDVSLSCWSVPDPYSGIAELSATRRKHSLHMHVVKSTFGSGRHELEHSAMDDD
jgi:hypothetical protein